MDFGSEMLSVDHADISKRDIGNNRRISRAKQKFFQSWDCEQVWLEDNQTIYI
jgi:hypothetical protein